MISTPPPTAEATLQAASRAKAAFKNRRGIKHVTLDLSNRITVRSRPTVASTPRAPLSASADARRIALPDAARQLRTGRPAPEALGRSDRRRSAAGLPRTDARSPVLVFPSWLFSLGKRAWTWRRNARAAATNCDKTGATYMVSRSSMSSAGKRCTALLRFVANLINAL